MSLSFTKNISRRHGGTEEFTNPGPCSVPLCLCERKFRFFLLFIIILAVPVFGQNPAQSALQFGRTFSLDETLSIFDGQAEFRWDPFFASGTIVAEGHQAAFISGEAGETGVVLLDHKDIMTLPLPFLEKGNLRFPETFVTQVKSTFYRYVEEDRVRYRIAAIVIDPGHGGRDPGASRTHTIQGRTFSSVEKDIALKVGRQVHASLVTAFPDKQVLLTRNSDVTISLDDRVELANSMSLAENEEVIYISIHANGSSNKNARGYEVWYLSPGHRRQVLDRSGYAVPEDVLPILNHMLEEELTTESILLANSILKRMEETVGRQTPSRGLKAEEWFVVRNAKMPSVLVELGFVSNEAEALLMRDEAYLKKLSDALYKGICDFVAFFEHSGGLTALQ